MRAILNEISIPAVFDQNQLSPYVDNVLSDFILLSKRKFWDSQLKLHLTINFSQTEFGSRLFTFIYSNSDWETQALFSGLIDCASIDELINKHEAVNDRYLRVSIVIDEQESESLGAKVITYSKEELGSFYSFNSHSNWSRSKIDLKAYTTTANFQRTQALNFSGLNLESARTEEFLFLLTYKYLELKNWNPSITPFPNYKVAEEEYRAKCQAEIDNCKSSGEAVAVYRKYGKYFCFTNGYSFNENISSINSSGVKIRDIYSAGAGNAIRFISIDVENGGFELCDSDGTHLGSFGWNGTKISDAKISTHSIRLSK